MLGRSSARPAALPRARLRSIGRAPAARGLAAAVLAVVALTTAANTGPASAADSRPHRHTCPHDAVHMPRDHQT
ncbi:hypothetical protein [Streptomyces sp. NPDC086787]|uniref:hypothetical protein n=1 Tax=Streptomyces sp. NPDC086787 TaxID=3365759 RepID=UPI0038238F6D